MDGENPDVGLLRESGWRPYVGVGRAVKAWEAVKALWCMDRDVRDMDDDFE